VWVVIVLSRRIATDTERFLIYDRAFSRYLLEKEKSANTSGSLRKGIRSAAWMRLKGTWIQAKERALMDRHKVKGLDLISHPSSGL